MRKLLGGKNILLMLFIISLFSSFFVTNSSNSAFAKNTVEYKDSMCEEMGLKAFNPEWYDIFHKKGCLVKYLEKKDGVYKPGGNYGKGGDGQSGNSDMYKFDAYVQEDTNKPCASGFKS